MPTLFHDYKVDFADPDIMTRLQGANIADLPKGFYQDRRPFCDDEAETGGSNKLGYPRLALG